MTRDEAVWQAIQRALAKKQCASESERNTTHRPGKNVTIRGIDYFSITMAALAYNADPLCVCQYTRDILVNPTGKKKDNSKRKGNTNGGKAVIVKQADKGEEYFPSMKAFAESRGYNPESVREDRRKGMTFEEIDKKYNQLLNKKNSKVVDGRLFKTEKEICDYLEITRQTLNRWRNKGYSYQEIADCCKKRQSKHDDILNFKINDNMELRHIIDFSKELPERVIALNETDCIHVICSECKKSHSVSVRKIKSYADEYRMPPLCHTCAMRKLRGEATFYHGMHFPSQRALLQLKGIEKMASRITSLTKDGLMTFEMAVDFLVEEKLEKTRAKRRGYRDEFDESYDGEYKIIDYVDIEQCRRQGIDLSKVRVDKDIPLRCPTCDSKIKAMKLRYLKDRKPLCQKCDNEKNHHISSYDAVAFIVMASRVLCEYQKQVKSDEGTYYVDVSVTTDKLKVAVEVDGNRYHDIEKDTRKTNALLSSGYDLVIRLREDNEDGTKALDVPESINYHFPNNPFKNQKNISLFARNLTDVLGCIGLLGQDINAKEIQEIKKKLSQNLTIEKVLSISSTT